jgi:hypothetical protein
VLCNHIRLNGAKFEILFELARDGLHQIGGG